MWQNKKCKQKNVMELTHKFSEGCNFLIVSERTTSNQQNFRHEKT